VFPAIKKSAGEITSATGGAGNTYCQYRQKPAQTLSPKHIIDYFIHCHHV
jgi:hypothetical protein